MFTGLVETIGSLQAVEHHADGARFVVQADFDALVLGESIAVNGVCLTVTEDRGGAFCADASHETLQKTNLGEQRAGGQVHLERAMALGARMGGHVVTGHVDGVGRLVRREPLGDSVRVFFEVPETLAPFMAPKGSVTIDGVSLTINGATGRQFDVALVPYTREHTLFDHKSEGGTVNLEVDVLAKYVARLLNRPGVDGVSPGGSLLETLKEQGYV